MTMEPETPEVSPKIEEKSIAASDIAVLEDLFSLGYAKSDKITIYQDPEKNLRITATFRTLTPPEIRDIIEATSEFDTFSARDITEKIETLARTVTTVNGMPLILDHIDREEFIKEYKRDPTPLDMARIIFLKKIKSLHVIDALYEAYTEFADKIKQNFDNIKKNLKNPKASK